MEGSPLDRAIFSSLIGIGLIVLIRRNVGWAQVVKGNYWIFLLFTYMGFSILWSDFADVSFKRWTKALGDVVMTLIVLTDPNPLESIAAVLRRCFYIHLPVSIVLIEYFKPLGIAIDTLGHEMWVGLTTHKNMLGAVAMTSSAFFIWNIARNWKKGRVIINVLYLLMSFGLLLGSGSDTSMFVLFLGVGIFTMLQRMRSNLRAATLFAGSIIILITCFALIFPTRPEVFTQKMGWLIGASGRDSTLTGRTDLWYDMLRIASRHRFLGVGYGAFWVGDLGNRLWETYYWHPAQGHNGYLDVYVELGVVGITLLVFVIFSASKGIMNSLRTDFEYGTFRMTVFIMLLVHNIGESSFLRGNDGLWFMFLLIALSIPSRIQEQEVRQ